MSPRDKNSVPRSERETKPEHPRISRPTPITQPALPLVDRESGETPHVRRITRPYGIRKQLDRLQPSLLSDDVEARREACLIMKTRAESSDDEALGMLVKTALESMQEEKDMAALWFLLDICEQSLSRGMPLPGSPSLSVCVDTCHKSELRRRASRVLTKALHLNNGSSAFLSPMVSLLEDEELKRYAFGVLKDYASKGEDQLSMLKALLRGSGKDPMHEQLLDFCERIEGSPKAAASPKRPEGTYCLKPGEGVLVDHLGPDPPSENLLLRKLRSPIKNLSSSSPEIRANAVKLITSVAFDSGTVRDVLSMLPENGNPDVRRVRDHCIKILKKEI